MQPNEPTVRLYLGLADQGELTADDQCAVDELCAAIDTRANELEAALTTTTANHPDYMERLRDVQTARITARSEAVKEVLGDPIDDAGELTWRQEHGARMAQLARREEAESIVEREQQIASDAPEFEAAVEQVLREFA